MTLLDHPLLAVGLLAFSFLIASYSSVVGGGAMLSVPLFAALGIPVPAAIATMRVSSVIQQTVCVAAFARQKKLRWNEGLLGAVWSMPGAVLGAKLTLFIDPRILTGLVLFSILAMLAMMPRFRHAVRPRKGLKKLRGPLIAAVSLVLGIYGGLYGAGFSTLVMMLFLVLGVGDAFTTSGSASIVTLGMALAASVPFLQAQAVAWEFFLPYTLGGALGSWLGVGWAAKYGWRWIRGLTLVLAVATVLRLVTA